MPDRATDAPLLSLIIPCFNSGEYLSRQLVQLFAKRSVSFEVLIVDDGSTDDSKDFLNKLAAQYPNVCVIHQENQGAGVARNNAIEFSAGRFVMFVDADDEIDVTEASRAVVHALEHDSDLVFTAYRLNGPTEPSLPSMWKHDQEHFGAAHSCQSQAELKSLSLQLTAYPWIRLISRELLVEKKIGFGTTPVHNDLQYHWQSICESKNINFWSGIVCTHHKHASGSLSSERGRPRLSVFDALGGTYRALADKPEFMARVVLWRQASTRLLEWNRKKIDPQLLPEFDALRASFHEKPADRELSSEEDKPVNSDSNLESEIISVVIIADRALGGPDSESISRSNSFEETLLSSCSQSIGREHIETVVINCSASIATATYLDLLVNEGRIDAVETLATTNKASALNLGVTISTGSCVIFLNESDQLAPTALTTLREEMGKTQADYCFGNTVTISRNLVTTGRSRASINRIYIDEPYSRKATLYKRDLLVEKPFPVDFRASTWMHAIEIYLAGYNHAFCDLPIVYAHQDSGNAWNGSLRRCTDEHNKVCEYLSLILKIPLESYLSLRDASASFASGNISQSQCLEIVGKAIAALQPISVQQADYFQKLNALTWCTDDDE